MCWPPLEDAPFGHAACPHWVDTVEKLENLEGPFSWQNPLAAETSSILPFSLIQCVVQRCIGVITVPPVKFFESSAKELKFSNQPAKKSFSTVSVNSVH